MNKADVIRGLGTFVLFVGICIFISNSISNLREDLVIEGDAIARQAEIFKDKNGRFPASLNEMGLPDAETGPLYYTLTQDGKNFMIWYGTSLGESVIFYSEYNEWRGF